MALYSGLYVPKPNLTCPVAYMDLSLSAGNFPWVYTNGNIEGDLAGTATSNGGIVGLLANGVQGIQLDQLATWMTDTNVFPNKQSVGGSLYDEFDIPIGTGELSPRNGYLGRVQNVRQTFGIAVNSTKTDFSRLYIGSAVLASVKYSIPWDNVNNTVPTTGATAAGVTFTSTSP
jgi:hypothetical protein